MTFGGVPFFESGAGQKTAVAYRKRECKQEGTTVRGSMNALVIVSSSSERNRSPAAGSDGSHGGDDRGERRRSRCRRPRRARKAGAGIDARRFRADRRQT